MKRLVPWYLVAVVLVLVGSGCESKSLGDTWTRPTDEMVMAYVPEGEFEMGSDDGFEDERPVHTVALDGIWIDRTEVTNAQYLRCVETEECKAPGRLNTEFKDPAKTDHPKVNVKWFEAEAYCEWAGARLPTEAEWEYAARGPEGREFPWGDEFDGAQLNYCDVNCPQFAERAIEVTVIDETVDDGYEETAPVGSYAGGASWCGATRFYTASSYTFKGLGFRCAKDAD